MQLLHLKKKRFLKFLLVCISYIIVIFVTADVVEKRMLNPEVQQKKSEERVTYLLKKVSKLTILPSEKEIPYILPILNAEGLILAKPFFTGSQNGDLVIVYEKAGKVIVYREKDDTIINTGPLNVAFIDSVLEKNNLPTDDQQVEEKVSEDPASSTLNKKDI